MVISPINNSDLLFPPHIAVGFLLFFVLIELPVKPTALGKGIALLLQEFGQTLAHCADAIGIFREVDAVFFFVGIDGQIVELVDIRQIPDVLI